MDATNQSFMIFSVGKLYDLLKKSIQSMEISLHFTMKFNFLVDHKSQNLSTFSLENNYRQTLIKYPRKEALLCSIFGCA